MAFEALKAELDLLMQTVADAPEDRFGFYIQLKEKLNQARAFGYTPPQDLVDLEAELDKEFTDENAEKFPRPS
ncbi:hypothetical protein Rvan_2705 [Rhodomicrobium vannielii ATCC 17100]|uniref:Uncharacterized protein n=1 Tax=Rhodomicrobium vannielii (strain ATCC 17100 / DSM 162 / LMG 4299 / NCIMB 10020 / ATH 3.1.1) TaxID=648757 RepID=E3I7J7_RHOVT|nr:hypothetical protein [Rhodomicrobium vannielii]ADP71916.1 hypothetical protein Rvan_2705 [Rhodomicrobium vannielii ATCC 17100]